MSDEETWEDEGGSFIEEEPEDWPELEEWEKEYLADDWDDIDDIDEWRYVDDN